MSKLFLITDSSQVATASWLQDFTHLGLVIIPAQLILLVETLDKSSLTQLLKISKDDENNNKPIIFDE